MNSTMEKQIRDIIKLSLPAQTADELQKAMNEFLDLREKYSKISQELESTQKQMDDLAKRAKKAEDTLDDYKRDQQNLEDLRKDLAEREEKLRIERSDLNLTIARTLLSDERAARERLEEFMINMSKNTVFKRTVMTERSHVIPPTPGLVSDNGVVHQWPINGRVETTKDKKTETIEEE